MNSLLKIVTSVVLMILCVNVFSEETPNRLFEKIQNNNGHDLEIRILEIRRSGHNTFVKYELMAHKDLFIFDPIVRKNNCQTELVQEQERYQEDVSLGYIDPETSTFPKMNIFQDLTKDEEVLFINIDFTPHIECTTNMSTLDYFNLDHRLLEINTSKVFETDITKGCYGDQVRLNDFDKVFLSVGYVDQDFFSDPHVGFFQYINQENPLIPEEKVYMKDGINYLKTSEWGDELVNYAIVEIPLENIHKKSVIRKPEWTEYIRSLQKRVWGRRR